jgi:hypothetical protein
MCAKSVSTLSSAAIHDPIRLCVYQVSEPSPVEISEIPESNKNELLAEEKS